MGLSCGKTLHRHAKIGPRMSKIPIARLQNLCDPFNDNPWDCEGGPITTEEIASCIEEGNLVDVPVLSREERHRHIGRIAYLAMNGWDDAISVDVGVPSLGCHVDWPIEDGNHRFAAAIYGDKEFIEANLSGSCDYLLELFATT